MGVRKYNYTESEKMMLDLLLFLNLNKGEKTEMMLDRVNRNMSLSDIATKFGVSKTYVHKVEMRVLKSIRTALNKSFRIKLAEYQRVKQIK